MRHALSVFEPPAGGVPEHVTRLAHGLAAYGWEIALAGPSESPFYGSQDHGAIMRLPFERGIDHPLRDLASLRGLISALRSARFELVHAHSAKAGVLARLAARATGTPTIYSPHCFPFVGPQHPVNRALYTLAERCLGPGTDAIVCVAEQERKLAIDLRIAPVERLHVIHNGTAPCAVDIEPDPDLEAFAGRGPLAACLTALRPQKAVHVFLEAAPRVLAAVPEARLAVIGDGELRATLELRARELGLPGERLAFFPFRPPPARQLGSLDVFVLPSAYEAFPISVLEAMACGVPQVATNVGGTSEALEDGETGLLCPPDDPSALADRLIELLRDPERRARMATASRARHEHYFPLEGMVRAMASLYDAVADGRSADLSADGGLEPV